MLYLDTFSDERLFLTDKAIRTPEGFLKGRSIVTNTGIFNYLLEDGTVSRQLREPDEVFKQDSLQSLRMKPITLEHPDVKITHDNIQDLQKAGIIIGFTGSCTDAFREAVSTDWCITNKDAIEMVLDNEMRAWSCGYTSNTDFTKTGYAFGNNMYNAIQKDILYNHLALVKQGRAGELAVINMDSRKDIAILKDVIILNSDNSKLSEDDNIKNNPEVIMDNDKKNYEAKLNIDGIDYHLDKDVVKHINSLIKNNESLTKVNLDLTKSKSELQGKLDAFSAELKDLKDKATNTQDVDEKVNVLVKERIGLVSVADSLEVKFDKNDSNQELKKKIISLKNKDIDLKDKDDLYVNACFDTILGFLKADVDNGNTQKVNAPNLKPVAKPTFDMAEEIKRRTIEANKNYHNK